MRYVLTVTLIFWLIPGFAQEPNPSKDDILQNIYNLQLKNDPEFADGLFVSERYKNNNIKRDNNIFFPALINLTLENIRQHFNQQNQQKIDSINARVERNYYRYYNRKGDLSYNYWQTHPYDWPMPGSKFWSKSEKVKLPDDLDCTSIIYLTLDKNDSIEYLLKKKFIKHSNLYDRKIKSIFRKYQNHKAYMTWFAKYLKQDFDICVMANTMLYIFDRGFPLNEYDEATIDLIMEMVKNGDHLRYPHIISPYYKTPFIILYHLSRLLAADTSGRFDPVREIIIKDIQFSLDHTQNRMEKVLLLTALYKLNVPNDLEVDLNGIENDFKGFDYFVVNPFHGSNITFKRIMGRTEFLHFFYRCEAYYWTLILEYLVWKEQRKA